MYNDSRLLMQIIRMNLETALIAPSFAPTALKIIAQPLDAHATSLLHAAAGLQHYVVIINFPCTRSSLTPQRTVPSPSPASSRR